MKHALGLMLLLSIVACQSNQKQHLLHDISPNLEGQWISMTVEIPAGSNEKWEVNKENGRIERDSIEGKPRTVNYIAYPGNYGFIPQTLLPKEAGGDGDPLDILAIGHAVERGEVIRCKIVGVLKLLDNGEQDDKLIAIAEDSPLSSLSDINEISELYPGTLEIIETWFKNYKGAGEMQSEGFQSASEALSILEKAIKAY